MSDINWDLAPEGATEIVQHGNHITWRKGIKIWCFVQGKWCDYVSHWKTIATRPQPERKTVEDAVADVNDIHVVNSVESYLAKHEVVE